MTTKTVTRLDVVAQNRVPFRAVFVPAGVPSPNRRIPAYPKGTVEFYDRRYDFTPDGQFVSDYFVETLIRPGAGGLVLHGGVPAWIIDAGTMVQVTAWIVEQDAV